MGRKRITVQKRTEEQENIDKLQRRGDLFLILSLLLIAAAGMLYLFGFRSGGDMVRVTVDGELCGVYSLAQDRTEEIRSGENGVQKNLLVISGGKASVEYATCPDGICAAHRPIFRSGESIICLPHGVVIAVVTENDGDGPDIAA